MENGIKEIFFDELCDIFNAEEQIVEALPEVIAAVESSDLRKALEMHLNETRGQIQRLNKVFKILKIEKKAEFCKGMRGLIEECEEILQDFKSKSPVRDAAIIPKLQRIEHYEIAAYGSVRTFAKELDLSSVADLLQETLDEEGNADKKLTKIAEGGLLKSGINHLANTEGTSRRR